MCIVITIYISLIVGKAATLDIKQTKLGRQPICLCQSIKYLGIHLTAGNPKHFVLICLQLRHGDGAGNNTEESE